MNGEKNVNVVEIINNSKDVVKPTNQGIPDDYLSAEGHQNYPRDEREHIPLDIINGDETKPLDPTELMKEFKKLVNKVLELESRIEALENA